MGGIVTPVWSGPHRTLALFTKEEQAQREAQRYRDQGEAVDVENVGLEANLVPRRRVEPALRAKTVSQPDDIPEQIEKLAELKETGSITNEEFEAKKKDLLDRM